MNYDPIFRTNIYKENVLNFVTLREREMEMELVKTFLMKIILFSVVLTFGLSPHRIPVPS